MNFVRENEVVSCLRSSHLQKRNSIELTSEMNRLNSVFFLSFIQDERERLENLIGRISYLNSLPFCWNRLLLSIIAMAILFR